MGVRAWEMCWREEVKEMRVLRVLRGWEDSRVRRIGCWEVW